MLPRQRRVREPHVFRFVLSSGRKVTRGAVVVHVASDGTSLPGRAGFIVSKQVGNSVSRHRVARVLRHASAPLLEAGPLGTVLVVRALPGAASSPTLAPDLAAAFAAALATGAVPADDR